MDRKTIGQIAAATGVVASLLLVVYELRQNRAVAQLAAYSNFVDGIAEQDRWLASDPTLAPLVMRVGQGESVEDFTDEEGLRLRLAYTALLREYEGLFVAGQTGLLPPNSLDVIRAGPFRSPWFREIWPSLRSSFSPEFALFFEALTPPSGPGASRGP